MTNIEIEILGSAGAVATPRALCKCKICDEARLKGVPFARSGPGYFIHGPDILIDTSEDIRLQLTRSNITDIKACFYSHWHPDHVLGRRIWESNFDFKNGMQSLRSVPIYLPKQVAEDFKKYHGTWDNLEYLQSRGAVELKILQDGESVRVGDLLVRPFRLAEPYVYGFVLEDSLGNRALVIPDETYGWAPTQDLGHFKVAILPMGLVEKHPISGARQLPDGFAQRIREATFEDTLQIIKKLDADSIILSHIEEPDGLSHDELGTISEHFRQKGVKFEFAFDALKVRVQ